MTAGPDPFEYDDAAYVLGALSHEGRIAYEEHLQGCARCTAAVAEVAMLPGLLARTPGPPATGTPEQPPDTVLPGLLARLRRSRRRRRVAGAAAAAAAAAVLIVGTALVTGSQPSAPDAAGVPVTMVGDVPVRADLHLEDVSWGTRITMTCRYYGPVPSGSHGPPVTYQLVVVSADRSTQSVARWEALPGKDATVAGSTNLTVDEIAQLELRTGDGTLLLAGSPTR
jgi:anti-sigma factor RsiW